MLPKIEQKRYAVLYGPVPSWMVHPDRYRTAGVSGSLTAQPNTNLSLTLSSQWYNSHQQQGSLQQALTQLSGKYVNVVADTLQFQNVSPAFSPALIENEMERVTAAAITSTNNVSISWKPRPWLPLFASGGISTQQRVDQTYIPYGVNSAGPDVAIADTTGSFGLGRGTALTKTFNLGTAIPMKVVTTAIGANFTSQSTSDFSAYTAQLAPGVSVPTQFIYAEGTGPTQQTASASTYGWYLEPKLNFHSRFFVTPGFRLDGGSASGAHGGFGGSGLTGFPKINMSYLAVEQSQPKGPLTLLRPRLAFGVAGTQPGPTQKLRLLNQGGGQSVALDSVTTLPEVVISSLGNTKLRPETSRELEWGLDAELWDGRLAVIWTQSTKTRYNAIISVPVAPSVYSGFNQFVNVGTVRNTETDLSVDAQIFRREALSWHVGVTYFAPNNRVLRLDPSFAPNRQLGIVVGYPLYSTWARPIVAVADINHNGFIDPTEYTVGDSLDYVGQEIAKYNMGLFTNVTLFDGRLAINADVQYQNGMTQNNLSALQSGGAMVLPNRPGTSLETQAAFVAALCGADFGNGNLQGCQPTPIGVIQTVSVLRFRSLSVNYVLPTAVSHWLHVPRAFIGLQGSNLGLHSNYRGKDPNVNAFSTVHGGDQTADLGQLPQPRIWLLKLSLGN
jgi:hypothetical protein